VISEDSVDSFKNRLPVDEFWCNQAVLFDYKVDLTRIGNGSFRLFDILLYICT